MSTGLKISPTEEIYQMSGPSSMAILGPDAGSDYFRRYPTAPFFMLFGDIHFSITNLCERDDGKDAIYNVEFLEMMSSILNPNEIIDFYTEGGMLTNHNEVEGKAAREPMFAVWNMAIQCARLDQSSPEYERVKKINWIHGDIRLWTEVDAQEWAANIADIDSLDGSRARQMPIKRRSYYNMYNFLCNKIENNLGNDKSSQNFTDVFVDYAEEIKQYFSLEVKIFAHPDAIYNKLVNDKFSLIHYQIQKIPQDDQEYFKLKIKEYVNYVHSRVLKNSGLKDEPELRQTVELIHKHIMWGFHHGTYDQIFNMHSTLNKEYEIYKNFILHIESIKLDVFSFAVSFTRMVTRQTPRPILSICYFGQFHVENIAYFLKNILGYKSYMSVPDEVKYRGTERCLNLRGTKMPPLSQLLDTVRR
jgi:hypothetical protein